MAFKVKKSKKAKKWRGLSRHGHGARKKWKGSGGHGGAGMSGSGKRADHKKSLVIRLYGNNYFGKQGVTSRSTKRKINDTFNLSEIESRFDNLMKKFGKNNELVLENYKILGEGEIKRKVVIKARGFSNSAKEKIEKAGGSAIIFEKVKKVKERKVKEKPSTKKETKLESKEKISKSKTKAK